MAVKKAKPRNYSKMSKERAWSQYQLDRTGRGGGRAKMAPKKRFMEIHFPKKKG